MFRVGGIQNHSFEWLKSSSEKGGISYHPPLYPSLTSKQGTQPGSPFLFLVCCQGYCWCPLYSSTLHSGSAMIAKVARVAFCAQQLCRSLVCKCTFKSRGCNDNKKLSFQGRVSTKFLTSQLQEVQRKGVHYYFLQNIKYVSCVV